MSEYFVGTTGSNSQTTFEALSTSEVLDDLGLNTTDSPTFSGVFLEGSGNTIFSVDGANGRLFGVTDEVTGTIFSVNDAAGLPILEVESTAGYDKITIGEYGSDLLVLSGQTTAEVTGSQIATQSWISDQGFTADTNYYLTGIEKSSNTLSFKVNGASDVDYTFGSNAFTSTTIPAAANNATITISAGTNLGGGGSFTTDQSSNGTITINHDTISRSDTTSSETLSFGGSFDAVDGITSSNGHVTAESTMTYTLPSITSGDITGAFGADVVLYDSDGAIEATEFIGDVRGAISFKAQAAEAITKGEAVYISGVSGNTTVVALADANDATKMPAFGIAGNTAGANNPVTVINFGELSNLDTDTPNWDEGDELFVSTTAGGLTTTAPTSESSLLQKIAKVTKRHASTGSITVMGAGRTNAVPNLNEGRLFVGNSSNQAVADGTIHVDIANSRVGIGTTGPSNTLDINGGLEVNAEAYIRSTSNVGLRIQTTDQGITSTDGLRVGLNATHAFVWQYENLPLSFGTNGSQKATILANGNFGIGTTSPSHLLEIDGGTENAFIQLTTPNTKYAGIAFGDPQVATAGRIQYYHGDDSLQFDTTSKFTFEGGNVGIGTTSPAEKLTVIGDILIDNGVNSTLYLGKGAEGVDGVTKIKAVQTGTDTDQLGLAFNVHPDTAGSAVSEEAMRIDHAGNVGIGTTSPSNFGFLERALQISAGSASSTTLQQAGLIISASSDADDADDFGYLSFTNYQATVSNGRVAEIRILKNGTNVDTGEFTFHTSSGSGPAERMRIDKDGNVGIGTTSPSYKLHVSGNSYIDATSNSATLTIGRYTGQPNIKAGTDDGGYLIMDSSGGIAALNWYTPNNIVLANGGGNVGIGDTTPSYKLDVNGTLRAVGAATFDSNVTVAGNLTVNGTTTTINSTTISVDDKNIELGSVASPTDTTADGGGITLKGATDKTINWVNSTDAWTFSERIAIPDGTAAAPALTFTDDTDTGIYRSDADALRVITGGSWRGLFNSSGITSSSNVYTSTVGEFRNYAGTWKATTGATGNGFQFINSVDGTAVTISSIGRINASEHVMAASNVYADGAQGFVFGTTTAEGERIYRSGNDIILHAGGSDVLTVDGDNSRVGIGTTSPSSKLDVAGDINTSGSVTTEGPDGGMVMRTWTGDSAYGMIGTANMSGNEYALLTNGTNTYISAGASGFVSIRGGNNDTSPQLKVTGSNIEFIDIPSKTTEATALVWDGTNVGYRELGSAAFSATSDFLGATAKAADSDKLDNLDSTQFLRSDADDETTGNLNIQSSDGSKSLRVGDVSSDNYVQISQDTSSSTVRGFTNQHSNASVIENLQGSTNQHIVLGDVDSGNSNTLFGVSITSGGTTYNKLTLSGAGNATFAGSVTATSLIKSGGTSSQFLKADGSVDSNSYSTTSHNHTLDSLSNVTITSNTSGEVLRWSGSAWINSTLSEAGIQPSSTALTTSTTFGGDVSGTYNAIVVANDSHTHNANNLTGTTLASGVTASSLTSVGTISSGTWQGSVIASAYLDADTAHLSGTQTFSGAKTFSSGLNITVSTSNTQLKLKRTGTATGEFNIYTNNDTLFFNNVGQSSYPMVIDADGNVGIGTTSPAAKLHIDVAIEDNQPAFKISKVSDNNENAMEVYHGTSSTTRGIADFTNALGSVMYLRGDGNVGIGTTSPSAKLEVNGHFAATTKSFIVDNPKTGGKLQYGVVESDQHSVFVRGKNDTNTIELPEEWEWLVDEESVTVQLTSIGQMQQLFVISQDNKTIKIGGLATNGKYNYTVYGERKDVAKLKVNI